MWAAHRPPPPENESKEVLVLARVIYCSSASNFECYRVYVNMVNVNCIQKIHLILCDFLSGLRLLMVENSFFK